MIKRNEDIVPVGFVLLITIMDIAVWYYSSWSFALLYAIAVIFTLKGSVIAYYHHVSHCPVFKNRVVEFLFHQICMMHTLQPPSSWVSFHNIGHHRNNVHMNTEKDKFSWKINGKRLSKIQYGLYHGFMAYPSAISCAKGKPNLQKRIFGGMIIYAFLMSVLFHINPTNTLIVFLVPQVILFFAATFASYWHHVGLETNDVFSSCRNNTNKWYNILNTNLGYHTAHHYKQGVHWSDLPELHKQIEHLIPKELITDKPKFSFWTNT